MAGGTAIGSGGTVTGVGVDWSAYEGEAMAVYSVGATPSGSLIARLCAGTAVGDVATVLAVGTVLPGAGGTLTGTLTGYNTAAGGAAKYTNVQLISTGGTVLASAELIGKKRTLTA